MTADCAPNAAPPADGNPPRTPTGPPDPPPQASHRGPATAERSNTRSPRPPRTATCSATRPALPPRHQRRPPTADRNHSSIPPASARSTPEPRLRSPHCEHASAVCPDPGRRRERQQRRHSTKAATALPHSAVRAEVPRRTPRQRPLRAAEQTHPDCPRARRPPPRNIRDCRPFHRRCSHP